MAQMHIMEELIHGTKAKGRKEAKEQRKVAKVTAAHAGPVAKQAQCSLVLRGGHQNLYAFGEHEQ